MGPNTREPRTRPGARCRPRGRANARAASSFILHPSSFILLFDRGGRIVASRRTRGGAVGRSLRGRWPPSAPVVFHFVSRALAKAPRRKGWGKVSARSPVAFLPPCASAPWREFLFNHPFTKRRPSRNQNGNTCVIQLDHARGGAMAARWAHNPEVAGSSPAPATAKEVA